MVDIDLEELYKQSQSQGVIDTVKSYDGSDVDLDELYENSKKGLIESTTQETIQKPSLLKEFGKANEQLSSGMRANLQGRSFQSGFEDPKSVPKFQDTIPQGVMNLLEKSKFLREHPNAEQALFQTFGAPAKLAGIATDIATSPLDIAGGIAGNRFAQMAAKGLLKGEQVVGEGISSVGNKLGFGLKSKIGSAQDELSSIAKNAAKEIGASEAQVGYNIKTLKEAKASELGRFDSITKEAESLNARSIAQKEGKKSILGQKLPDVAYQSGQNIRQKFISTIKKHSDEYNKALDNLIGGKNQDIYISNEKVLGSIEDALLDRNVPMSFNEKNRLVIEGAASSAENKLVNLYNKLHKNGQDTTIGIREVLKDKQMLGRGVKYGKSYGYEDDLINDVVQRLGKRVEKEIPGLKELNGKTSKFLRIKDEANQRLDIFKQGSPKPREFVEAFAQGNLKPEQKVFLESLRKELPQFDKLAKAPKALAQGMEEYDMAINALKKNPKEAIPQITARFDEEIGKLQSALDVDVARIGNESTAKSKPIIENISRMESKLSKLKRTKDALVTASAIAGGMGAAGYWVLRPILNYGYNTVYSDK